MKKKKNKAEAATGNEGESKSKSLIKSDNKYVKQYMPLLEKVQDETEKQFLITRVMVQMAYYSNASQKCKRRYQSLALLSIVFNGVIPVLMLVTDFWHMELLIRGMAAALSAGAGILTAISSLKNYRETWIQYRVCLERLKLLLDRYFLGVGDFSEADPQKRRETLQLQCELILTGENQLWQEWLTEARKNS